MKIEFSKGYDTIVVRNNTVKEYLRGTYAPYWCVIFIHFVELLK